MICRFLSAVYVKYPNGTYDLLCDPIKTESQTDLRWAYSLTNARKGLEWVKVEFLPPSNHALITDPKQWTFVFDDQREVSWFDEYLQEDCIDRLKFLVTTHIASRGLYEVLRDWRITCDSSRVYVCGPSKVYAFGSSKVFAYDSSRVIARGSSQVNAFETSIVDAYDSSTVIALDSSIVYASGSSKVIAFDSSKVFAYDSSRVIAWEHSEVIVHDKASCVDYRKVSKVMDVPE